MNIHNNFNLKLISKLLSHKDPYCNFSSNVNRKSCSFCIRKLDINQLFIRKLCINQFSTKSKFLRQYSYKKPFDIRFNKNCPRIIGAVCKSTVTIDESYTNSEGHIVHHAKKAAIVITGKKTPPVVGNIQSEPSSCRDESSINNKLKLEDVEYVVEAGKAIPAVKLSGALPSDALDWRPVGVDASKLPAIYASLAKSRLTGLVVASALGGYVLCPAPFLLSNFIGVVAGTSLISAAANTTNQILEVPYDSQMKRTRSRVLVRGQISPLHAAIFAGTCGISGVVLMNYACNPLTASLGLVNLILYTSVYTPMKRSTIANTWMGAVVGAIPPLMGWAGCSGNLIGPGEWGAWLMAGLLFAWQFPHFNALSWNLRRDYSQAGYRMMCVTNPRLCKVTCMRYSTMLLMLGFAAPALDVTTWTYAVTSTPFNAYMLYLSYRFYKDGDSKSSKKLFKFSLFHLPAVMVLMIISKIYNSDGEEEKTNNFTNHYLPKINSMPSIPQPQIPAVSVCLNSENKSVISR